MSGLPTVAAAYEQIDLHFQSLLQADTEASDELAQGPIDQKQKINDQAYFVLAWGQLEADIEEACREAIRAGQSLPRLAVSSCLVP